MDPINSVSPRASGSEPGTGVQVKPVGSPIACEQVPDSKARRRSGLDFGWMVLERAMKLLAGLVVSSLVARHLGPAGYGELSVALGVALVFASGAAMGAEHFNVSELSARPLPDARRFLASALATRLLWAMLLLVAYGVYALVDTPEDSRVVAALAPLVLLAAFGILGNTFQASGDFATFAKVGLLGILVGALFKVGGILGNAPLWWFALCSTLELVAVVGTFGLRLAIRQGWPSRLLSEIRYFEMRAYWRLCLPMAIAAVGVALYLRVELFVVAATLGAEAAGFWAAAAMFTTPWVIVIASLLPVANQRLARMGTKHEDYDASMVRLVRWVTLGALCAAGCNVLVAALLVPAFFGPSFSPAVEVVWITSLSLIPLAHGSVQDISLAQRHATSVVLKKVVLGIPLSAFLLLWLAEEWGLPGAAVAMVLSHLTTGIIMNLIYDRSFLVFQARALGFRRVR